MWAQSGIVTSFYDFGRWAFVLIGRKRFTTEGTEDAQRGKGEEMSFGEDEGGDSAPIRARVPLSLLLLLLLLPMLFLLLPFWQMLLTYLSLLVYCIF